MKSIRAQALHSSAWLDLYLPRVDLLLKHCWSVIEVLTTVFREKKRFPDWLMRETQASTTKVQRHFSASTSDAQQKAFDYPDAIPA